MNMKPTEVKVSLKSGETLNIYMNTPTLNPSKEVLIGVHGWLCDHRCLKPLFPYLEKEFQMIVPDFRGQGKSGLLNPVNGIEDLADELLLIMDHFKITKASLFAWSFGCQVAICFAVHYPSRVKNLFLIAPSPLQGLPSFKKVRQPDGKVVNKLIREKGEMHSDEYNHITLINIKKQDKAKTIELLKIDSFDKNYPRKADLEELADQILLSQDFKNTRWALATFNSTDEEMHGVPGNGYCKKIQAPVYLFIGEKDYFATPEALKRIHRNFPTLKNLIMFDAPHATHYYYPEKVSEYMLAILGRPLLKPKL